jgi:RHS repeat-associated protein
VLARYAPSGNKTLLTDALMSVIAQANDSQGVDNFYAYSPYGEVQTLGPDGGNSLQYTGRENDGTGLYYYRARYYDPVLKRFISEDPIGLSGGDTNLNAYVNGDPVNFVDPHGLKNTATQGPVIPPGVRREGISREAYENQGLNDALQNLPELRRPDPERRRADNPFWRVPPGTKWECKGIACWPIPPKDYYDDGYRCRPKF